MDFGTILEETIKYDKSNIEDNKSKKIGEKRTGKIIYLANRVYPGHRVKHPSLTGLFAISFFVGKSFREFFLVFEVIFR